MSAEDMMKYFNLTVDGRGFAGKMPEYNPPALTLQTSEFRAGGMDAAVDIETGMEKLTTSYVVTSFDSELLAMWGVTEGGQIQATARGSTESMDGTTKPIVHNMTGKILSIATGTWGPNNLPALTVQMSLVYYKQTVSGRVLHEIDVVNMVRVIDGVDQLAEHRANIGL